MYVWVCVSVLLAGAIEYADNTSAEEYPHQPMSVLFVTLNCI